MKICGIQKTTLIDYPGQIACTLFLFGCNFRCGFCHNPELVLGENKNEISQESVLEFLLKRRGQLEGVCITGGEPLLNIEKDFLRKIKDMGYKIKLDTNGSFPERLKDLIDSGLIDYVAMDIKITPEKYSELVNYSVDIDKLEESIKLISGLENYEFRTTVIEGIHTQEEIRSMFNWLLSICPKPKKFVFQGFKNYGKFVDKSFKLKKDTSDCYLKSLRKSMKNSFDEVEIRV